MAQVGTGTTTLTGVNTYTGPTNIQGYYEPDPENYTRELVVSKLANGGLPSSIGASTSAAGSPPGPKSVLSSESPLSRSYTRPAPQSPPPVSKERKSLQRRGL